MIRRQGISLKVKHDWAHLYSERNEEMSLHVRGEGRMEDKVCEKVWRERGRGVRAWCAVGWSSRLFCLVEVLWVLFLGDVVYLAGCESVEGEVSEQFATVGVLTVGEVLATCAGGSVLAHLVSPLPTEAGDVVMNAGRSKVSPAPNHGGQEARVLCRSSPSEKVSPLDVFGCHLKGITSGRRGRQREKVIWDIEKADEVVCSIADGCAYERPRVQVL